MYTPVWYNQNYKNSSNSSILSPLSQETKQTMETPNYSPEIYKFYRGPDSEIYTLGKSPQLIKNNQPPKQDVDNDEESSESVVYGGVDEIVFGIINQTPHKFFGLLRLIPSTKETTQKRLCCHYGRVELGAGRVTVENIHIMGWFRSYDCLDALQLARYHFYYLENQSDLTAVSDPDKLKENTYYLYDVRVLVTLEELCFPDPSSSSTQNCLLFQFVE